MKITTITTKRGVSWDITGTVYDGKRMQLIPGARARRGDEPAWRAPATVASAKQLMADFPEAEWTEPAKAERKALSLVRKDRRAAQKLSGYELVALGGKLTPLQADGYYFLMEGSGLLGDDMGSGKTVMTCAALHRTVKDAALVVTTTSTVGSWAQHVRDWTDAEPFVFHGTPAKRRKAFEAFEAHGGPKVLVTSLGTAMRESRKGGFGHIAAEGEPGLLNRPWDVLVWDECHKSKDPKNKSSRAMFEIRKTADIAWALTGTPINDSPDDLWTVMHFVEPRMWPSRKAFRERYCIMRQEFHGGYTNLGLHPQREAEMRFFFEPWFLRRLKQEVLVDLPEALPVQYIELDMTPAQAKLYRQMKKDGMALVDGELLVAPDPLSRLNRFDYISSGIPDIDDEGNVVGISGPSNKLDYILDVAENRKGDPFVVFAPSRKVVEMLARELEKKGYRTAQITGSVAADDRTTYVRLFQEGHYDVMLLTSAGAEGITLTASDLLIFADLDWRAITNQQVRDRIHRFGQQRHAQVQVLMSAGTVDIGRRWVVEEKVDMQESILHDEARLARLINGEAP